MPVCIIDGQQYEFNAGETIIELADRVGVTIPRYCYHPALTVVAQCRMCAVEVEKMPKLQTACSTPLADGMVINTKSEKVKSMQSSVMEFLLANHPLDCPICDKSGECDLQNYSYDYGTSDTRYDEFRRTYMDLDMGPVIKKNMNRCIHCTRCIRFCDEVAGFREMVAMNRGNSTEIVTIDGKPLQTDYAGNLADICPTGSLTLKDFRFKKRVWYLKKTKTVCEGCSRGCNIELDHENNVTQRILPRENKEINKWWICDEGRFNYHYIHSADRILEPTTPSSIPSTPESLAGMPEKPLITWKSAVAQAKVLLGSGGKELTILVGSDLTQEELTLIQKLAKESFAGAAMYHFGTPGHLNASDDKAEDAILKRTSKTSNLYGADKLGIPGFPGFDKMKSAKWLVITGGRAELVLPKKPGTLVGIGVFLKPQANMFDLILPGLSYAEKSGTIYNFEGREQKLTKALEPVGQSRSLQEVFQLWK